MKITSLAKSVIVSSTLLFPFLVTGVSFAQSASFLECSVPNLNDQLPAKDDIPVSETQTPLCDLSIIKEVSVNGSVFAGADTAADAPFAFVGDQVTWRITVTNASTRGAIPTNVVTVSDILPAGFNVTSFAASNSPSMFTNNQWSINAGSDSLPATLTIVSTASSAGEFKNTASLVSFLAYCDGECVSASYADANPINDTDSAFIAVKSKAQVLGQSTTTPTLLDTGTNTVMSALAVSLLIVTAGLIVYTRRSGRARNK